MIPLITGQPGHGKTLYALNVVKARAEKEGRPVYYNGIPELKLPWIHLDNPEEWYKCPAGSIIVIDECQRVFRPRGAGAAVPEHVAKLETHRHQGFDIYLITQHPMLVDSNIRRLVGQHFHVVRAFGTHKATIHEWGEVKEQCNKSREGSIRHDFFYPKESFGWYKSAELHTHKRNIPMRIWFLLAVPFIIAALGYYAYTSMFKKSNKQPAATTATATNNKPAADEPIAPKSNKKDDYQWLAEQKPRIVGLPHTAPMYDALATPARMPLPSACISMGSKCECFTQQGTRIANVQETICREIVANGWFNPYREEEDGRRVPDKPSQADHREGGKGERGAPPLSAAST